MTKTVYSIEGKELRTIELSDTVFNCDVSEGSIYHAIRNELANLRVGTACVKTRSEVNGTTAKPYAQKGTGRARAGRWKSPVRVGGGIIFGPRPRSYNYKMPRKLKRLAMKSILSMKSQADTLMLVEDFSIESGKTKDLARIMMNLSMKDGIKGRTILIMKDDDPKIKQAGKNIPWLKYLSFNRLRAHDLYYGKTIIVLETAAKKLSEFYAE